MGDFPQEVWVFGAIGGEAANALRSIATIIGCPTNVDPLTDLDGLVSMVRVVTADRDALRDELARLKAHTETTSPAGVGVEFGGPA